jgi:SAM-dependent methyltransferase
MIRRGARVSGLDAAEGLVAIAREGVPDGDLRVGDLEALPWDADSFDVVTAFNSIQYAADPHAGLATRRRRPLRPERSRRAGGVAGLGRAGARDRWGGATPFEFADLEAAWRSIAAAGPGIRAIREVGEDRAKAAITAAYAPFRQPDGRYRLKNAFRYVVARA